ncbi:MULTISPECIES: hypothetical protein [unclassified Caulobacter]|nr:MULTISPECIES: hypothetical protein [unclassified Caulobacter]
MTRRDRSLALLYAIAAFLALNVLIGDEVRGFKDGLVAGFSDER